LDTKLQENHTEPRTYNFIFNSNLHLVRGLRLYTAVYLHDIFQSTIFGPYTVLILLYVCQNFLNNLRTCNRPRMQQFKVKIMVSINSTITDLGTLLILFFSYTAWIQSLIINRTFTPPPAEIIFGFIWIT